MSQATPLVLEPAARKFAADTANPPYLFDLGPVKGRALVDQVQSGAIAKRMSILKISRCRSVLLARFRPHPAAEGRRRHAAGDPLHSRRRLGVRQRPHA